MEGGRNFIVVPEGLAARPRADRLTRPSWVFETVLERCHALAGAHDEVYLAPANTFGQAETEQAVAHRFLAARGPAYGITSFATATARYVDTRGNATLLRDWLTAHARWPLPRCTLVANECHLARARLVFEQEGFRFEHCEGVPRGARRPEPVVPRLWYYNHLLTHRAYERAALWASRLRWI